MRCRWCDRPAEVAVIVDHEFGDLIDVTYVCDSHREQADALARMQLARVIVTELDVPAGR